MPTTTAVKSARLAGLTGAAAVLGLAAGSVVALADAALTIATSPRLVLPPSGARVFFWALVAYPPVAALAGITLARVTILALARRLEPPRVRTVVLGAMTGASLLALGISAARRWAAGAPTPTELAASAAGLAVAGTAIVLLARRASRANPARGSAGGTIIAWLGLVASTGAAALLPPIRAASSRTPGLSIILITVDTLRADALGCYGDAGARTPAIDRLAAEGTRFADAQAQSSWTLTAHASIMTGLTVGQHGADAVSLHLSEKKDTIAAMLARRGYRTAAVVSSVYTGSRFGFAHGFESFNEEMTPPWTGLAACGLARRLGIAPRSWVPSDERRAGRVTAAALAILERERDGPSFLWLHYFDPHSDYDPPPPFDGARSGYTGPFDGTTIPLLEVNRGLRSIRPQDVRHLRAMYDGEVAYLDSELAVLFAGLERLGLAGRTAIVLTADHGESFYEHGTLLHDSLYQEVLHVPLLLWRPGLVPGGRVVEATVRQMDIAPTVAELAGVPWRVAGSRAESLLPLVLGAAEAPRTAPAERQVGGLGSPVTGEQVALVEWPWKLIAGTGARPQLFNLTDDPGERTNLAAGEPARVEAMSAALATEHATSGRPVARPEAWLVHALRSLGYLN